MSINAHLVCGVCRRWKNINGRAAASFIELSTRWQSWTIGPQVASGITYTGCANKNNPLIKNYYKTEHWKTF